MKDWMRRLRGLKRTAITRVEITTASCSCCSWPVRARKIASPATYRFGDSVGKDATASRHHNGVGGPLDLLALYPSGPAQPPKHGRRSDKHENEHERLQRLVKVRKAFYTERIADGSEA